MDIVLIDLCFVSLIGCSSKSASSSSNLGRIFVLLLPVLAILHGISLMAVVETFLSVVGVILIIVVIALILILTLILMVVVVGIPVTGRAGAL